MKITPIINSVLKNLANRLPQTYREGKAYSFECIKNLREREIRNNVFGQGFSIETENSDEKHLMSHTKLYPINHLKKLKRAYIDSGFPGVEKYILWVNENNRMLNEKYSMAMDMFQLTSVMKEKITPIFE